MGCCGRCSHISQNAADGHGTGSTIALEWKNTAVVVCTRYVVHAVFGEQLQYEYHVSLTN